MSSDLAYEQLRSAFEATPLFEDKSWRLSPDAWPLSRQQVAELEEIGSACVEFHAALEQLYLRAATGRNLLRNKPLVAPWAAEYLDRGKPRELVEHARHPRNRGAAPVVLRPDLLLTDEGFVMTELDSVPGGIGLTAFLNRLYAAGSGDGGVLGGGDAMIRAFHAALAALAPDLRNPLIALVVSEEAATYRPEMRWIAAQLQLQGRRVFCLEPDDLFPLGSAVCFDVEGNPEKVDVIYRFLELFDLGNLPTSHHLFESWSAGELAVTPPMRAFQEEKLALALFHHHLLPEYWREAMSDRAHRLLKRIIPRSWIMDPAPLPPGAVLEGPQVGGHAISDWRRLGDASQRERDLILKISGFHESAWGARSVLLGSDCSREEWQAGIEGALNAAPASLHILQEYRKPRRIDHRVYVPGANGSATIATKPGRLRLCPYYFVIEGQAQLSGALATFCPPDKKIIHGMQDAALLPARVVEDAGPAA